VLSSDRWAYDALAECNLARGDRARWRTTLEDYLAKTEDAGLEHANVRVKIANDLMSNGRYAEAWPYAEAAAQTWAGWAMTCAQNCAEGLKNWEAAEGYARASAEGYPGSMWSVWFVFCERTGHGDIAAARAWTKEVCADLLEGPDVPPDIMIMIADVLLICGDKDMAAVALRKMKDAREQVYVMSLAAVSDLAGANDVRDVALERYCTDFKTNSPKTAQILQMIRDALADKKTVSLDLNAVNKVFDTFPKRTRVPRRSKSRRT
jgi:hypothetical protein